MKERIVVGSAVGGLAILVAVALIVFQFGRENPSPPSLIENPNPAIPGELLFRDNDDCVVRATASGATREQVYCGTPGGAQYIESITWVDANTIGFVTFRPNGVGGADRLITKVDIASKQVVGEQVVSGTKETYALQVSAPDGSSALIDEDGILAITKDGQRIETWDTDVEQGRLRPVLWSPDSQWIVLFYTPPRDYNDNEFWIVSRDGELRGTLATDLQYQSASWRIDGVGITPTYQ